MNQRRRIPFLSSRVLTCGLSILLGLFAGCGGRQSDKDGAAQVKLKETADDTFVTASALLKQGTQITHYRDGLALVNVYLSKAGLAEDAKGPLTRELKAAEMDFLRGQFALDEEQLKYLGESTFQLPDAYHVEASFLFRDAARTLELATPDKSERALHALRWVARHVLLHEQGDDNLPPQFVLKRGFGNSRDRALVFLSLMRQMDMGGCLVESDSPEGPLLLVGLLSDSGLHLYDPRLGKAVAGPEGNATATLKQALTDPALLKPHGFEALPAEKVRLRLSNSLGSLAPRMAFLQNKLSTHLRITLYQDTMNLASQLEMAAGLKVVPWDAEGRAGGAVSPAHLLLRFLPKKEEGGADESNRLLAFRSRQLPESEIRNHLIEMRIVVPEVPEAVVFQLLTRTGEVFSKFLIEPRDMLLHGKPDQAIKRVNRILTALEEFDQREPKGDQFQQELAKWREQVNNAFDVAQTKKGTVLHIWGEDRYLSALLDLDREAMPKMASERNESLTLTFILFRACRRALGEETHFLLAQCLHDNAERQQASLGAALAPGKDFKDALKAWNAAQAEWGNFNFRYKIGPENLAAYALPLANIWETGEQATPLFILERLLLNLHESIHGRYQQCQTRLRLGQTKSALEEWKLLRADVAKIIENKAVIDLVGRFKKEARDPRIERRFDLLARDWQPYGPWSTWRDLLQTDPIPLEKKPVKGS